MTFATPAIALFHHLLARRAVAVCLAVAAAALVAPTPAAAQTAPPTRVAVVNTQRVFNEIQEFKTFKARIAQENDRLVAESKKRAGEIEKMRLDRENSFRPNTPQYDDVTKRLMEETARYKVWAETEKANLDFQAKRQTKAIFDRIQAATGEVAKGQGFDVVIVDTNERIPDDQAEKMDLGKLQMVLLSKTVMYTSEKNDITQLVITVLDGKFKATAAGK